MATVRDQLRQLAELEPSDVPVLSIYLDMRPQATGQNPAVRSGRIVLKDRLREIEKTLGPRGPALQRYQAGDREGATDDFLRVAIGPTYRDSLDGQIPGGYAQAVADADTFFAVELPSLGEWRFTQDDAGRITQPVLAVLGGESVKDWAGWPEAHARVQEWMLQTEPFVLAGSNHALEMTDPRGVATAMAAFFARHPMPRHA